MKSSLRPLFRRGTLIALSSSGLLVASIIFVTPEIARSSTTTTSTTTTTAASPTTTTTPSSSTTTSTTTTTLPSVIPGKYRLPWPAQGSAAIAIPALSVEAESPSQPEQSIASLTKMMTTWVVLHQMPLAYSQRGPCLVVNATDVAAYHFDVATDQSSVAIKLGERLCEGTLLRGMLVHSAGDYAQLLVSLTGWSDSHFVDQMNRGAAAMGMTKTRYADFTGISPYDRSTAHDQTVIAVALMTNEPIVRSIVALTRVRLPIAGVVISYTPLIGQDGVVGVKSGYTNLAGGCDVMTINYTVGATVITTYVVDLGQHSGNALGLAGDVNLDLSRSLRSQFARVQASTGVSVDWLGWPGYVIAPPVTTTTTTSTTTSTTTTSTTTTSTTTTTIP